MAQRNDSSSSAHQNQTPTSHNEDAIPEMTETRGRADQGGEADDEFEEVEELDEEEDEGSFRMSSDKRDS